MLTVSEVVSRVVRAGRGQAGMVLEKLLRTYILFKVEGKTGVWACHGAFETSKLVPNDTPPLVRPCLSVLHKIVPPTTGKALEHRMVPCGPFSLTPPQRISVL